jgi:signal transduction histidine kinase/CheY-like chemotaxis protein
LLELKEGKTLSNATEIMALFPSVSSVLSFKTSLILQQLFDVMENSVNNNNNNDVENLQKIRIIIPYNKILYEIIQKFKQNNNSFVHYISEINDDSVEKAVFLIVDRKISLVIKIKEQDNLENPDSDRENKDLMSTEKTVFLYNKSDNDISDSVVYSHVASFEALWNQTENFEDVKNEDEVKREDFINICAHELRSPIQPILGLSLLVRNKVTDSSQREMLDIIIRNAKRLKKLTNDLLEIAKIESGMISLEKEKFNLTDFINNIIKDYENKYSKEDFNNNSSLNIIKVIPKDIVFFVEADKDKLIQVIFNILNNAVGVMGYNYDNNPIKFSLKQSDKNEIQISIKDMGPGIDINILPKLFSKFVAKPGKGIGLGLFITKSIVEAHGGKIWAENNSGEKGATFFFTLPIIMQIEKNTKVRKVLLVVKIPSFALSLKTVFEKNGDYIVDILDSPLSALQIFIAGYYDFVILDIEMSELNGFDLSSQLRLKDDNIQVVFLTSGETNYEPIRDLYGISDKNHFIKKTLAPEKILMQLGTLNEIK